MYSSCLFCHADLGRNELVESFPVGRRLAYDGAHGRLWVVCRKCERWNLTPIEERWVAIDECERLYRDTRARISTDQIALARATDGKGRFDVVRIGRPQRPELAAWRYGDQFGRRRRRHLVLTGAALAAGGALVVAGPVMGIVSVGVLSPILNVFNVAHIAYSQRTLIRLPMPGDRPPITLQRKHLGKARLVSEGGEWHLSLVALSDLDDSVPWWKLKGQETQIALTGTEAVRAAAVLLPPYNDSGASPARVQEAVQLLERHSTPDALFGVAASESLKRWKRDSFQPAEPGGFKKLPAAMRLALEMASHEETERRAMEGELALLEAAWKDAEAIARIADSL
jgi:hypothetical protein